MITAFAAALYAAGRGDQQSVRCGRHSPAGWDIPLGSGIFAVVADALATNAKPDRAALAAAYGREIPDLIGPGLSVLFCGINPGLWSAAVGHHFGRPGNRFWPALHAGGLTPRQLRPDEQAEMLDYGYGITNLVRRATARADELAPPELAAAGPILVDKVRRHRPTWLAVLGSGAYRTAFGDRTAVLGPQPARIASSGIWVLPNPSGLNAHYPPSRLAEEFAKLRRAVCNGDTSGPASQ